MENLTQAENNLTALQNLTGFPTDFIKSELLIDQDNLSLAELRESMLKYLDSTFNSLQ